MATICSCNTGLGNLGVPNCYATFKVAKQVIFVEYFNGTGGINGIDLSALTGPNGEFSQADLDALVQNLDPGARWYPTPQIKNVTNERAEDLKEDFDDGTSLFIQKGARVFNGMITKADPTLYGNIEKARCSTVGYFIIDKAGNLQGNQTRPGFLDPVRVEDETISGNLMMPTDAGTVKIGLSFGIDSTMDDADLAMITADQITANLLGVGGIVDAFNTNTATKTTTELSFQLDTSFGGVTSRIPVEDLVLADFTFFNVTTALAVVPATVVESPTVAGFYTATYAAQTASDVMRVTSATLDKNYEIVQFEEALA